MVDIDIQEEVTIFEEGGSGIGDLWLVPYCTCTTYYIGITANFFAAGVGIQFLRKYIPDTIPKLRVTGVP